jgi:hypothetical protein
VAGDAVNITSLGIAVVIAPILLGICAVLSFRNHRGLFVLLVILTVLMAILAAVVLDTTVFGHVVSSSKSN